MSGKARENVWLFTSLFVRMMCSFSANDSSCCLSSCQIGDASVDIETKAERKQVIIFEKIECQCHFHQKTKLLQRPIVLLSCKGICGKKYKQYGLLHLFSQLSNEDKSAKEYSLRKKVGAILDQSERANQLKLYRDLYRSISLTALKILKVPGKKGQSIRF